MAFLETPRFPENMSYGVTAGPEFQTNVIIVNSGHESRNVNWASARARYDVGHHGRTKEQTDALIAFFRAVKGRAHGFRFKDWTDYQVTHASGRLKKLPGLQFQLQKHYTAGVLSELRTIAKPVAGTVQVLRNGVTVTAGNGAGQYRLDATTGRLSFREDSGIGITSITQARPGVVTTVAPHGFVTGNVIDLIAGTGMTELHQAVVTITVTSPTSFSIGIDTSAYSRYAAGAFALKTVQPNESLSWQGDFDVPCRFDIDQMQVEIVDRGVYSWGQIPIVEIRT